MTRLDVELRRSPDGPARPVEPSRKVTCVGPWELVQLAAEGSLARVYQARPAEAPPDCPPAYALKMLRPEWQDDSRAVALIRREALVGRAVAHPHLISVLAAQVAGPPYYVVMPWLEGRTLARRTAEGKPLDLPVALWIARQVAEGLAALDKAGWIHGDVKPANILVSPDGHATLLDLGFARRPEESGSATRRCVMGTCHYIAPELTSAVIGADIRSDIYSLGGVLFELLTGRLPFAGKTQAELVRQHRQARAPAIRDLAPEVPAEVARLVQAMLAKDPLRRPQNPRELVDRLAQLEIAAFAERRCG